MLYCVMSLCAVLCYAVLCYAILQFSRHVDIPKLTCWLSIGETHVAFCRDNGDCDYLVGQGCAC